MRAQPRSYRCSRVATKTIRVMVYQMGPGPIIDTLEAKARAGVNVRIILDLAQKSVNDKYMDAPEGGRRRRHLERRTLPVHACEGSRRRRCRGGHLDQGIYADFGIEEIERNFVVRDADAADVDALARLFDADFARKEPDLTCTRLLVSPVNAKQRLLDFIASARTEMVVESMQLADRECGTRRGAQGRRSRRPRAPRRSGGSRRTPRPRPSSPRMASRRVSMKSPGRSREGRAVDGKQAYAVGEPQLDLAHQESRGRPPGDRGEKRRRRCASTFEKDWSSATPF